MKKIILASTSPRRIELLGKLGLKFTAVSSDYEEDMSLKMKPVELAKFLSKGKAEAVRNRYKNHIIIAADSFVALKEELLGKPKNEKEAAMMLKKISDKTVLVITGYTLLDTGTGQEFSNACVSKVFIRKLTDSEIKNYIKTKEPMDKAGAFAIQGIGAAIIKKVEGDFLGAIGLPLYELAESLKRFGVNIL